MMVDQQARDAVAFVMQSTCEAQSNVLHLNLKKNFNKIISNIITAEVALVINIFQYHQNKFLRWSRMSKDLYQVPSN
jgi:hypothetical protein